MLRQDQHVDPEEAQEIVRLAARQQSSPVSEGPTVDGLAEALNLPPEEVQRLLGQVRSRKAASQAPQQRQFGDRSAALSAGIVLALVLVVAVIGLGGYLMFGAVKAKETTQPAISFDNGGGERIEVGPSGEIVHGSSGEAIVAPAAPAAPAPAAESSVEAEKAAADKMLAERALEDAKKALADQSKALSEQERQDLQQKIEDAQEALKKLEDKTPPAAASGG